MKVKELAEICNVHYNTMRKWLSDNNIEKANNVVNAPYLITDDVIKKAKKHFLNENEKQNSDQQQEQIDSILIEQLAQKDAQIVKQQNQIDHLQKLLENQQILTLKAQEKINLLESKENKEEKKSFWKNIFNWLEK